MLPRVGWTEEVGSGARRWDLTWAEVRAVTGPAWGQKSGKAEAVLSLGFWFRSLHQTIFTLPIWKLWPPGTCNYPMRNCVSSLQLPGAQIPVSPTCAEPGLLGIMVLPVRLQPGTGVMSTVELFPRQPWLVHPGEQVIGTRHSSLLREMGSYLSLLDKFPTFLKGIFWENLKQYTLNVET